ncbi:PD-(D/E)XK nuclease family protein [Myroides odoratus]
MIDKLKQLESDSYFQKLVNDLKEPNLFNVLKLDRYEIRHSTFLAWLLDPNEKHCLGNIFLSLFLSDIVKDKDLLNQAKFKWIKRETENDIDIFIEFDNMIIAVENKIDSDEHSDQLTKYTKHLKSVYPHISNHFLVFLTPNGKLPKKNNEYIVYSYSQIAHHIESVLKTEHLNINTRARIYIEDYLHSINENLMKNNPENILAAELYAKYKDTFDFVMQNVESDLNYITNKFNHFLHHKLPNYVRGSEDYSFSRFTTKEISNILKPVKSAKRAWKNKEPFLFEISLEKEERRIVFLLSVSDFDLSLNQCLHKIFMQQGLICANENNDWKIYNNIAIPFDFDEFKNDSYIESKIEEIYKIAEPIIQKTQDIIVSNKIEIKKSYL